MTLEKYLEEIYTRQTANSYLYTIENFLALNKNADRCEYQDIVDYFDDLGKKQNERYCSRVLASVKVYYNFLLTTNHRDDHPCRNLSIKSPKRLKVQLQDLFTSDELESLLLRENRYKHIDLRNNVIISLLIYQGLTSGEITKLKIEDIDIDNVSIRVKASSKLKKRILGMHPKQVMYFTKYLEARSELANDRFDTLIVSLRGIALTVDGIHSVFDQFKLLFSGRKLSPQTIRQSVIANWLNDKGKSVEETQKLAGHKYISTTQQYLRILDDEKKALINKFHPLNKF